MADIELLTAANFSEKSLDSYERRHEVKKVYRRTDDGYALVEQPYVEDWDLVRRREIANKISGSDYVTYVAVEDGKVVGFIGLKKQLVGNRMILDMMHVSAVSRVKPENGKYDIALHGSDKSAEFFGKPIDAYTLAKIIKSRKDYKVGTPIRLLSCNTGNTNETGNCFAQLLANELHTTVYAPTEKIYVNPDGSFVIGKKGDGEMKNFIWRE